MDHPEKPAKFLWETWDMWEQTFQKVLPEVVREEVMAMAEVMTKQHREELLEQDWTAVEVRNIEGLPPINFSMPTGEIMNPETKALVEELIPRIQKVFSMFGYDAKSFIALNILLDPTVHEFKNVKAAYNEQEGHILVKMGRGLGFDHEIAHWVTLGLLRAQKSTTKPGERKFPPYFIESEGIAAWAAWHVKNKAERAVYLEEDYTLISTHLCITRDPQELTLDTHIHPVPAMSIGGMLFEVIYEELGKDTKKVGEIWKTVADFSNVSSWLEASGLNPKRIEMKWKGKLFRYKGLKGAINKILAKLHIDFYI